MLNLVELKFKLVKAWRDLKNEKLDESRIEKVVDKLKAAIYV